MLIKTKGIVLGFTKYRDSAIIARIYTEEFGSQSYMIHGARSGKSKRGGRAGKMALYQPLTFLEIIADHKAHREVQRISEAKVLHPFQDIPFNFTKSTIAIFLSEVLSKALREEAPNPMLFHFLFNSFLYLDQTDKGYQNFHLQFLLKGSLYLGFGVESGEEWLSQLQLQGVSEHIPKVIDAMIHESLGAKIPLTGPTRSELLHWTIRFYQLHLGGFGEIKSLPILQELWR